MRILLRVAYDGTEYCGWQIQPDVTTIEGVLHDALENLYGHPVEIIGASRTDSGVHALGNVAVYDVESPIPAEKVSYALNARLPKDIRIVQSKEVPADFHPRHTDVVKTYEYQIYNHAFENPLCSRYAYFVYGRIDLEQMKEASGYIIGEHDFTSFCSAGSQVEDKHRTVYSLDIEKNDKMITIRITGNGFLYNMVRIIAGTLLKCGQGQMQPIDVKRAVEGCDRSLAGPTAPALGLKLVEIKYRELME